MLYGAFDGTFPSPQIPQKVQQPLGPAQEQGALGCTEEDSLCLPDLLVLVRSQYHDHPAPFHLRRLIDASNVLELLDHSSE